MSEPNNHVLVELPAYALGALSAPEAAAVRRHLEDCASCREELMAYEAVTADLALAVPLAAPPPGLESRLLERISPGPAPAPARSPSLRDYAQRLWQQFSQRPLPVAVAGLALLLLFFLAWLGISQPSPFATFPTVALAGTDLAPEASGVVVSSEDGLHGTVIVQRLFPLEEEEETYQLWLIEAGVWEDGGAFTVDEDGYGARYARASILLTDYDAFAVTIEPAGGSDAPTGPVVLRSD